MSAIFYSPKQKVSDWAMLIAGIGVWGGGGGVGGRGVGHIFQNGLFSDTPFNNYENILLEILL